MKKKYELTDAKIDIFGHILHRIEACRSFSNIRAGDLGGYIESEANLSHVGNCWVSGNARVFSKACVFENAQISGKACVFENAQISGNAWVYGTARVFGNAWVYEGAGVYGDAWVCGSALVSGTAWIRGDSRLDSGIWNQVIKINDKRYLISTTLQKKIME